MRFLYKRQPHDELKRELEIVRNTMCSGEFVLFDLLFYSFIFSLLIIPENSGAWLFCILFFLIYLAGACVFLIVRRIFYCIKDFDLFQR